MFRGAASLSAPPEPVHEPTRVIHSPSHRDLACAVLGRMPGIALNGLAPHTYADLCAVASRHTVDREIGAGRLVRVLPNQYALAEHADSWLVRAQAAVAWAAPGAALSGPAALAAWGHVPTAPKTIDVVVPAGTHRSGPPWLRVRSLTVPYRTATWMQSTEILLPDLALVLSYGRVPTKFRAEFLYGAARAGLVTAAGLRAELARVPRISGREALVVRIASLEKGAESYLEERGMAQVFRGRAFADIIYQHWMRVRGQSYRIDAFHPSTMTAFELDGAGAHGKPESRQKDITRDAVLATAGVLTTRFTYQDVDERAAWCADIAREVLAARGAPA